MAAMALQSAGEVEFQKHNMDFADLDTTDTDQLVDIDRARGERAHDPLALGLVDIGRRPRRVRRHAAGGDP